MKKIKFVDHLVTALTEYNKVNEEIKKLDQRKQEINLQVRQWFTLNEIDGLFEIQDLNKTITQISSRVQSRRSVADYDLLKQVLAQTNNENLINETESETFTIKTLKKHTDPWALVESRKYDL